MDFSVGALMGREAEAQISFQGATGAGKLLLEGAQILSRGEVRARIAREDISHVAVQGDDLILSTPRGTLTATLGAKEAAAWVRALGRPLPSLAEKLGVHAGALALVVGEIADPVLGPALGPFQTRDPRLAGLAIAEMREASDLDRALRQIGSLPLWAVTIKGKSSPFSDASVRRVLRAADYVDTKSCAVSRDMTATRWQKRRV